MAQLLGGSKCRAGLIMVKAKTFASVSTVPEWEPQAAGHRDNFHVYNILPVTALEP
jgi:hypothetical protein